MPVHEDALHRRRVGQASLGLPVQAWCNNSALYALESRPFMRGRLDDAVEIGRWGCEGAPDPPAVEGEVEEADF